jgi:hypothetical protein
MEQGIVYCGMLQIAVNPIAVNPTKSSRVFPRLIANYMWPFDITPNWFEPVPKQFSKW